jgi:hypothetical protein
VIGHPSSPSLFSPREKRSKRRQTKLAIYSCFSLSPSGREVRCEGFIVPEEMSFKPFVHHHTETLYLLREHNYKFLKGSYEENLF